MPQFVAVFGKTECRIVLSSGRGHYIAQVAYVCSGRLEPLTHANGDLVSVWATSEATAISMVSAYLIARFGGRVTFESVPAPAHAASSRASSRLAAGAL